MANFPPARLLHATPLLVRQGIAMRLDCLTPPAGMLPDLPARQEQIQLFPGDWLLIFTDGIPEAANASEEEFGDDRLIEALCRFRGGTPTEMCEGIVDEIRNHLGEQSQQDDITLIAVKLT